MDNCCESLVKYILFLFNFVFAITGLALIGLGAYVKIQADHYLDFVGTGYVNTPIFIIIVGLVIFVIAFFGCCGACKESPCMMYTYAVILCFILIAEVGAGIAAYILKGALKEEVTKNMKVGMQNYKTDGHDGVTQTWDLVQHDLKCCGVEGPGDWANTTYTHTPDSCCVGQEIEGCGTDAKKEKYERGCLKVFEDEFLANIGIVGGVAIGIACIQAIGVFFACCIGNRIRRQGDYV